MFEARLRQARTACCLDCQGGRSRKNHPKKERRAGTCAAVFAFGPPRVHWLARNLAKVSFTNARSDSASNVQERR